jgi:hypothetical protein
VPTFLSAFFACFLFLSFSLVSSFSCAHEDPSTKNVPHRARLLSSLALVSSHTHSLFLSLSLYSSVIRAIVDSSCHLYLPSNSLGRASLRCRATPRPPLSRFPESSQIWDINELECKYNCSIVCLWEWLIASRYCHVQLIRFSQR